jgi:protein phosphatase-4 regulatory subunit 3
MGVFKICEDLENVDGLHMIFNIVKGIILLNSSQILEKIFGDELIMEIIGCLEYDPGVPHSQHHRNFLKEHVVFKEAIPIKDPLVLSKIHQTYRIGYLKVGSHNFSKKLDALFLVVLGLSPSVTFYRMLFWLEY